MDIPFKLRMSSIDGIQFALGFPLEVFSFIYPQGLELKLLGFWTLSIVGILNVRKHNVSKIGGEEDTYSF
jgi:hypothetical protein